MTTLEQAQQCDRDDPLRQYAEQFYFPHQEGEKVIYFSGNSLGLQPKNVREYINAELEDWAQFGVKGHTGARHPWLPYHEFVTEPLARLVGAYPSEVVAMNGLTVNLHLMMVSFYRPTRERFKIVIEKGSFPSDRYAVCSQIAWHGYDIADALIEIGPRDGEHTVSQEDISALLAREGKQIALVLLGGVNYYTGQVFDIQTITHLAKEQGCVVGCDLAHAVGNLELALHDWGVDFAVWCHYKYLNAGPGAIAGVYVHERHCHDNTLPRLNGWWGHDKDSRFKMPADYKQIPTAEAWQLSNPPIFQLAALRASLALFDAVGMKALRQKSVALTTYLYELLAPLTSVTILTPAEPAARGAQLSLLCQVAHDEPVALLDSKGVICDYREPGVIRVAPTPLYNSFEEVFRFVSILKGIL